MKNNYSIYQQSNSMEGKQNKSGVRAFFTIIKRIEGREMGDVKKTL